MPALGGRVKLSRAPLLVAVLVACKGGGSKEAPSRAGTVRPAIAAGANALPPAEHDVEGLRGARGAPGVPGPSPGSTAASQIRTVFLILLENKAWSEIKGSRDAPYLNGTLLPRASIAEGYRAARGGSLHPSLPNYVWLEAGDNLGITDDDDPTVNHRNTNDHLVTLLEKANVSWRSYQEDIQGDVCPLRRTGNYKPKHNPMVYFDDVTDTNDPKSSKCIAHIRPLSELERDLSVGNVARYNFITPNECNDMHTSCDPLRNVIKQGDDWLAHFMPKILKSHAYEDRGAVFVAWDEAESHLPDCPFADCPIGLFVLSPLAKGGGYTNTIYYDHGSTLRSVQKIFGVSPFLRGAATAADLTDLFTTFP